MAIDTAVKRQSAIFARRCPWMRRFTVPLPSGSVVQGDRQQLAGVYRGIEAAETGVVEGLPADQVIKPTQRTTLIWPAARTSAVVPTKRTSTIYPNRRK